MGEIDLTLANDFGLVKTFYNKWEEHWITFKSGNIKTQIDYFMVGRKDFNNCNNCKAILGEWLTTQHRILVLDVYVCLKSEACLYVVESKRKSNWKV